MVLDGELVYSKAASGRFPRPGEVAGTIEKKVGPALTWRKTEA